MKLRTKTLLIVTATLVVLVAVLNTVSREVLLAGFSRVEQEDMERNVRRVLEAFNEAVNNLSTKAADWAKWDDTYRYVSDWNSEYIESNLKDESLAELKLNLMLFFDTTGQIAYGRYCDLETGLGRPVSGEDLAAVTGNALLMRHRSVGSVASGFVPLPSGPMYIVSRPILTSTGEGPIAGTLIFGREIDTAEVNRVGQVTHLKLTVDTWAKASRSAATARPVAALGADVPIHIEPHRLDTMAGFARICDLTGKPMLLVHIDIPRDIYRQGRVTVRYLIFSIIAVGLLFCIIILVLLQKTVLSRVARLSGDVNAIAAKGDHAARVSVDGMDELTTLGRSVNSMLASLERVEGEIRSRNREMRMIMSTAPAGLLSIDERFRINPEYSVSVERIFGMKDLAGRDFFEVIGFGCQHQEDAELLREYLDLVLREPLSEREMAGLNPFEELCLNRDEGTETWVRLRFYIIRHEEDPKNHLLVVIEDITEAKVLSEQIQVSESEITRLRAIAEDPDMFRDFLAEVNAGITRVRERLGRVTGSVDQRSLVNDVFRDIHTIKGAADAFGLGTVVGIAAQLEEAISGFRTSGTITVDQLDAVDRSVDDLQIAIRRVEADVRQVLGHDEGDCGEFHVRISLEKLREASRTILDLIGKTAVRGDGPPFPYREICLQLQGLREIPARRALARALKMVPGLLGRFEKDIQFEVDGAEIPLDYDIARELVGPLIHMLRNAVDHGIEFPEERMAAGKTGRASIRVGIKKNEQGITLHIVDNGRGLDPSGLRKTAVARGLVSGDDAMRMSDDEAMRLIFRPGFTTADTATDVSGRGVGMDAVAATVERLHGTVMIDSRVGGGTTFTVTVPRGEC